MNYRNTEMKIDQLVAYLNEDKINLSPAFQRGHVWGPKIRRKLLANVVQGKPIPAVFLYKEAAGAKYSYNILDGKQRIESIILFVGNSRQGGFTIPNWERYFTEKTTRTTGGFWIEFDGRKVRFENLDDNVVRDLREYAIPTVEIQLNEETTLDEIISLFVDINQQGVPVNRFDVVKAMYRDDPLLRKTFQLIAIHQQRGQDVFYRTVRNDITFVLKRLQIVSAVKENNSKVDRMWEKLLELSLFAITNEHRKPIDILKGFISGKTAGKNRLDRKSEKAVRQVFAFLKKAYTNARIGQSRLATDQTHFYSLATLLLTTGRFPNIAEGELLRKLEAVALYVDRADTSGLSRSATKTLKEYMEVSKKQTTDVSRRQDREKLLKRGIENA